MWIIWEQLHCLAHSLPIVGLTVAVIISSGTCIVQIKSVRVHFACTKIPRNLSAEAIINARNPRLCVRNIRFKDQTSSFFLSLGKGVYIFEETSKSIQDAIGDAYCLGKYCSNREKCESLDGYVTTPRSIYCCGKCGACLFVHKVTFMLQEHINTTKTGKTRFSFAWKRWTWYPTNK